MTTHLVWFRRDLRLTDHPALTAAAQDADRVLPLFVFDPKLIDNAGRRIDRLIASLAALRADTNGALVVRTGNPADVVADVAAAAGATTAHISAETTPYGRRRDAHVAARLAELGVRLVATGSPYAVTPGRVRNAAGNGYRVFTPFMRAWLAHGWSGPVSSPHIKWRADVASEDLPTPSSDHRAGERVARARWAEFRAHDLAGYAEGRDRADLDRTSRLSVALKFGEIHPRTLLDDLDWHRGSSQSAGIERFTAELAWREFFADVLWHAPSSAWRDWRESLSEMHYDNDDSLIDAWREGRTGFPFVDAGLRQLLAEGWLPNRLRMVTASFLVKDLHIWWPVGARHFFDQLLDADIASNNHGWQWVAGTGSDSAPYFRIMNPVTQGLRHDPEGNYVRRWVPELRHLPGAIAHQPWRDPAGHAQGYPERIVDHAFERREALARFKEAKELSGVPPA